MLVNTYDQNGKEVGQTRLPSEIFGVKMNTDLLHQVIASQMANRRQASAHTKNRGEVSGGGKKPWRQKGTGRARHGSTRSPIWVGGGVTFGPRKEKVFQKAIPDKMRIKALFMALSAKAKTNSLIILDELEAEKPKTKLMAEMLKKLPCKGKTSLIALPKMDKNLILTARNIPNARTLQAKDLNSLDLLSFEYLIMPKESVKTIKETFIK